MELDVQYSSVERINRLIDMKGQDVLNGVCDELDLPQFRRAEVAFIAEYVNVMKTLAQALDILQCETGLRDIPCANCHDSE